MSVRTRSISSRSIASARAGEAVDRRDHLVTGVLEHIFVVERDQRLVLDDQDAADPPFALAEEHVGRTPPD